jgi:acetyl-CoA carboxylase biotin carboxyl carrier protein
MPKKNEIDQSLIRELADLLSETNLTEIEVEQDGCRIRVQRTYAPLTAAVHLSTPTDTHIIPSQMDDHSVPSKSDPQTNPNAVKSPMVGTCFRSPEPDAPTFVEVGDVVSEGDTLFLVEAMKTFNPIAAPHPGRVTAILVENGQPIEFGEPLIIIE